MDVLEFTRGKRAFEDIKAKETKSVKKRLHKGQKLFCEKNNKLVEILCFALTKIKYTLNEVIFKDIESGQIDTLPATFFYIRYKPFRCGEISEFYPRKKIKSLYYE